MLIVAFVCFVALIAGWFVAPNGPKAEPAPVGKLVEVPAAS